jgi:hypothetical protein
MSNQQYDNTNRGIVSKNDRKEKDTHPDIKGSINVEGVEYWLDGWQKQGSKGKFYSLSVKRKEPAQPQQSPMEQQFRKTVDDTFGRQQQRQAAPLDDSDIPF